MEPKNKLEVVGRKHINSQLRDGHGGMGASLHSKGPVINYGEGGLQNGRGRGGGGQVKF